MTNGTSNPSDESALLSQIEALTARCGHLQKELEATQESLLAEQSTQYTAYRQLVELERVSAFDDIARGLEHEL